MFHYSDFPTKIETQIETWKALFKKKHCIITFILLLQIYSSICQVMLNDLRVILNLFKMNLNRSKKQNQFNDYIFKNNTFLFSYSVKIKHLIHLFLK